MHVKLLFLDSWLGLGQIYPPSAPQIVQDEKLLQEADCHVVRIIPAPQDAIGISNREDGKALQHTVFADGCLQ